MLHGVLSGTSNEFHVFMPSHPRDIMQDPLLVTQQSCKSLGKGIGDKELNLYPK
jgi:hypothetical protein